MVSLQIIGPAVRVPPAGQTALLNTFAEFNCTTVEGPAIWIINGLQYVALTNEPHKANGITRTTFLLRGTGEYFTVLQVYASVRNNNTEIKCRASSDVESDPVFLSVQGILCRENCSRLLFLIIGLK